MSIDKQRLTTCVLTIKDKRYCNNIYMLCNIFLEYSNKLAPCHKYLYALCFCPSYDFSFKAGFNGVFVF